MDPGRRTRRPPRRAARRRRRRARSATGSSRATRRSSTRGPGRLPGLHRPARAPARAGPRVRGDDRDAACRPRPPAGSPPSARCRTRTPSTTAARSCEFVVSSGPLRGRLAALSDRGAITTGQKGEELAAFGEMSEAGAVAVSDDGKWLANGGAPAARVRAREPLRPAGRPAREDPTPVRGRARCTRAPVSTRLGLAGQPAIAEAAAVARDLLVAERTGGRLHVAHLSTAASLDLVRRGARRGHRRHLRGDAAPPGPDRRGGRRVGLLDAHEDEPAAARDVATSTALVAGARRRHGRRDRDRPRAAPRRREGGGVRRGAVRHRRARDGGVRRPRPSRGTRAALARAVRRALLRRPGPRLRAAGRDARRPALPRT